MRRGYLPREVFFFAFGFAGTVPRDAGESELR
jgi:hypothetical protein